MADKAIKLKNGSDILSFYPVGSIYMSVNSTNPRAFFGGTWQQIKDCFLLSAGNTYTAGNTGGEAAHKLTTNEMPAHTHGSKALQGAFTLRGLVGGLDWGSASGMISRSSGSNYSNSVTTQSSSQATTAFTVDATHEHTSVGSGTAHNNMPPYLVVYVWKRTA